MMQLIQIFRLWNYKITFLSSANASDYSEKMEVQKIEINNSDFEEQIKSLNPDFVLFDRYITEEQFGWKVSEMCPNAIKILDTEDLHFLREARKTCFKQNRDLKFEDLQNDVFKREIASILRCDLSLIISEYEISLLEKGFKIDRNLLFYLPFLYENNEKKGFTFQERKHFVSIGNFLHEPNWQTVLQLKKIWKNIRKKLPETEIHIYGAYAGEKAFQLNDEKSGFLIKGRAESVGKIFEKYRVLLAPIPFGAGLKAKLFESMIFGLPNVTTTIGAEAMHDNQIWNGYIEDSEGNFAEKAVALYTSENLWEQAQENGFKILKQKFAQEDFIKNFKKKIDEISANLQVHRNQNFLGKILQHQTLQSTKYLGKWIEEKNKLMQ